MHIPGTNMHIAPFIFACLEWVLIFYLLIYKQSRPGNKKIILDILLALFLLLYNLITGILPDPRLPGSLFVQLSLAYLAGFTTPCFFPYYVYRCFDLKAMKFHAYKGVFVFLLIPYVIFDTILYATGSMREAQSVLLLPFLYGLWVTVSLINSLRQKYGKRLHTRQSREETIILFLGFIPWVALPVNDYMGGDELIAALITNVGFLLLLTLHIQRHIKTSRQEHDRLVISEQNLPLYTRILRLKIDKVTTELGRIHQQGKTGLPDLVNQIKIPLTRLVNCLDKYIELTGRRDEFALFKASIHKLFTDLDRLVNNNQYSYKYSEHIEMIIVNLSTVLKESLGLLNITLRSATSSNTTQLGYTQAYERYNLTRREIEIVEFIQQAYTNKEIGKLLFIAERTVSKHVENLFHKVGVSNKIQLINKLKPPV
jgi:DNA-binding CsgD family transcriptional regulator